MSLPTKGSKLDMQLRALAASNDSSSADKMKALLNGSETAYHEAQNAYNAGGERYGNTFSINYAAVAQNPKAYCDAGIAEDNGDGTFTMLKLQDKESQQWIPVLEFYAKYPE